MKRKFVAPLPDQVSPLHDHDHETRMHDEEVAPTGSDSSSSPAAGGAGAGIGASATSSPFTRARRGSHSLHVYPCASTLASLPRDLQLFLARSLAAHEILRLATASRYFKQRYEEDEIVWRYKCTIGEIVCATRGSAATTAAEQRQEEAATIAEAAVSSSDIGLMHPAFDLDVSTRKLPIGILNSSVTFSEGYGYLLPSISGQFSHTADSPRSRLVLPRNSMLPLTVPTCSWKHVYRSLCAVAKVDHLPITSLILPTKPGLPKSAIRASSFDHPSQDIGATLKVSAASGSMSGTAFWSSSGCAGRSRQPTATPITTTASSLSPLTTPTSDAPSNAPVHQWDDSSSTEQLLEADEWLLYRSCYPLSFLTRLRIKVYQCYYQKDEPIYNPSFLRIRVAYDEEGQYHYTSPWYPVLPSAEMQDFFFFDRLQYRDVANPGPILLITGCVILIEMRGYNTLQPLPGDMKYYMVLSAVELEGIPVARLHAVMPPSHTEPPILPAVLLMDMHFHQLPIFDPLMLMSFERLGISEPQTKAQRHSSLPDISEDQSNSIDLDLDAPLSHARLVQLVHDVFISPLATQSLADYRVERQLFEEFATHLTSADWKGLGQRVADACVETPLPLGEQTHAAANEEPADEDTVQEQNAAPVAPLTHTMEDTNSTEPPLSPTVFVGRTLMYRRQRDLLLETVLLRSKTITQQVSAFSQLSPLSPSRAQPLMRSHCLAIATYLVQLLFRFVHLTEFESYILACVDLTVRGLLSPALQNDVITYSMRLGDVFLARRQYAMASQLFSRGHIYGRAIHALCHIPAHFPQLLQATRHVGMTHGMTHEDVMRMIVEIAKKKQRECGIDGDKLHPLSIHLKPPIEFAILCLQTQLANVGAEHELIPIPILFDLLQLPLNDASDDPVAYMKAHLNRILQAQPLSFSPPPPQPVSHGMSLLGEGDHEFDGEEDEEDDGLINQEEHHQ